MDNILSRNNSSAQSNNNRPLWKRFINFVTGNILSFIIEVAVLAVLVEILQTHYIVATALAFFAKLTFAFNFSFRYAFNDSEQTFFGGYALYFVFSILNILLTLVIMALLVEIYSVHYIIARISIDLVMGIWNFYLNAKFNFKISFRNKN